MNRRCIGISSHYRPIKTEAEEKFEKGYSQLALSKRGSDFNMPRRAGSKLIHSQRLKIEDKINQRREHKKNKRDLRDTTEAEEHSTTRGHANIRRSEEDNPTGILPNTSDMAIKSCAKTKEEIRRSLSTANVPDGTTGEDEIR
ncbi:hypothetical protein DPMN_082426 [Dreissena polymorpha]|uniref:Uncharacterized protein n=1 Tax=Dreissena polymorpha TaxID=45954 RepID=A0A9D3YAK8_DREPO|nr:hypothetical protein DPMN_082426 [Dreissena polymorpha]